MNNMIRIAGNGPVTAESSSSQGLARKTEIKNHTVAKPVAMANFALTGI